MPKYEIIPGRLYHCGIMARRVRPKHLAAMADCGLNPHQELRARFYQSSFCRAWLVDGQVAALGGVVGTELSSDGVIWIAVSELATRHTLAMIKEAKRQIALILQTKSRLTALLLNGDAQARRFASFFGFRPALDGMMELRAEWPQTSHPFVVFCLPRSRSRWTSEFLGYEGRSCFHDAPLSVQSVDELCEVIARGGSVETGLASAWRVIKQRFPDIRFAVIRRDIDEVVASAGRFGWTFPDGYLQQQERHLEEISAQPGTYTVQFDDLSNESACAKLFEHCLGLPHDRHWWAKKSAENIQIDMDARLRAIGHNQNRMLAFFADAASQVTLQEESFSAFYADSRELFVEHYAEAGSIDGFPLDPNIEMATAMERAGQLQVVTARNGSGVIGYLVFLINPSFESQGVLLGFQNIFYVKPEHRGTLGRALHNLSVELLKKRGVKCLMMRSGVRAKGKKQKFLFERLGAKNMGELYILPLEEKWA